MYCKQCRYPLRGLNDDRCPECGQWFDPSDERTFDWRLPERRRSHWAVGGGVALGLVVGLGTGLFRALRTGAPMALVEGLVAGVGLGLVLGLLVVWAILFYDAMTS